MENTGQRPTTRLGGSGLFAKLARRSSISLLLQISFAALSFLQTVLLARILGKEAYGIFAFVMALVSLLALPASFGLPNLIIRETARALSHKKWGLIKGIWRWSDGVTLLLSAIFTGLTLAIFSLPALRLEPAVADPLKWAFILVPLTALIALKSASLRGLHHIIQGQLSDRLLRPGLFILFLGGFALVWPNALGPGTAIQLSIAAAGMALVAAIGLLKRATPGQLSLASPHYASRVWAASALPLALTSSMLVLNRYTDVLMLGFLGTPEDVGVYRVAAQISLLVSFGLTAMNMVVAPQFAKLYEQGDRAKLQKLVTLSARAVLYFTLPATAVFILFGQAFFVFFFGESFASSYLPAVILVVGQLINSVTGSVAFLLNMTGHEKDVARGVSAAALGNIILNATLIPLLGINGAALATASTLVVWNVVLWNYVRLRLGINSLAFTLKR